MLTLRRLLESWMGLEPVAPGEDTQWHARFELGWPDWVVLLFVAAASAIVVGIYLREGTVASRAYRLCLAGLRLTAIFLVLVMLGGLEISIDRTGLPYLVFMVDDSESMTVPDRPDPGAGTEEQPKTRLQRVVDWLTAEEGQRLARLTSKYKLQLYAHSTSARLLHTAIKESDIAEFVAQARALRPEGTESRIGANLRTVLNQLRGTPPSAVVIITDGVTTQGESLPQAAASAARKNIPIFTVGVGDPNEQKDLQLYDLLVDETVFVDDVVTFEAKLRARGFSGEEVKVDLRRRDVATPLDAKPYRVPEDGKPTRVRLSHRPTTPGEYLYVLETPPLEREVAKENNRIERRIRVLKEKVRVLFVDSFPRYEFRFLKNLLERESTVELKTLLLDADPEHLQQDRSAIGFFPTDKQELFQYDVIVLGNVPATMFSQPQLQDLKEFVRVKGGGLLFVAGAEYSPHTYRDTVLAELLPVEIGPTLHREPATLTKGFIPTLTVEGKASPIFRFAPDEAENEQIWKRFPPIYWYAQVPKAKPGAQVLVEYAGEGGGESATPLVATQFYGAGRTYFQGFDSTWRWRYRAEDLYHGRYWIQAIRFLARAKLLGKNRALELFVDRKEYRRGEPVQLRVRFVDESLAPRGNDGVRVLVEQDKLGQRPVELKRLPDRQGVFEAVFSPTEDGRYRARVVSPLTEGSPSAVDFVVVPPPGELDHVQMNEPDLKLAAELTKASYYRLGDADALFDQLPPGRMVALHTDPPIALWNTWPMLLLFASLLVIEWVARKRKTLL